MKSLQDEIKQTRPFGSLQEEALLSIARTAAVCNRATEQVMRPHGITPTQYNVLRILRGAGDEGLCRNEVRDRLVSEVPDASRLLDRMEQMALISRHRHSEDRRYVTACITPKGLNVLEQLDGVLQDELRRVLGHMNQNELRTLIELLAKAREKA